MIYGAILEKGEKFYTHLKKVFDAVGNQQKEYNWLLSGCECCPSNDSVKKMLRQEYCWLSGEELTAIVEEEDFQWIWGVLSGFEKDIPLSEVLKYPVPWPDEYEEYWKNPLSIQHPLACFEIVPWDSSLVLILSRRKDLIDSFREAFPSSEDLYEYNERFLKN